MMRMYILNIFWNNVRNTRYCVPTLRYAVKRRSDIRFSRKFSRKATMRKNNSTLQGRRASALVWPGLPIPVSTTRTPHEPHRHSADPPPAVAKRSRWPCPPAVNYAAVRPILLYLSLLLARYYDYYYTSARAAVPMFTACVRVLPCTKYARCYYRW